MGKNIVEISSDLEEIVPGFLENREKDLTELKSLYIDKSFDKIQVIGHKMAGNAGSYGFNDLGNIGAKLEEAAVAKEEASINDCIKQIEDYLSNIEVKYVDE